MESILGVSSLQDLKAKEVLKVREVLLSQSHTESLQSRVGDIVAHVSQVCLEGLNTSGQPDQDGDGTVGEERLQMKFYEAVVRPFNTLVI